MEKSIEEKEGGTRLDKVKRDGGEIGCKKKLYRRTEKMIKYNFLKNNKI